MARNVEIKARIADRRRLLERARAVSGETARVMRQRDVYFRVAQGRLKLRSVDGEAHELIFYQRPDAPGPELSTYERVPVAPGAGMERLLGAALGVRSTVDKERHLFVAGGSRIHVDRVDGLGDFLELEVVLAAGDSHDGGVRRARELMARLGVAEEELVEVSYVDLVERAGEGRRGEPPGEGILPRS